MTKYSERVKYGGTWIDASVLMTKYEERFFRNDLFFFNLSTILFGKICILKLKSFNFF